MHAPARAVLVAAALAVSLACASNPPASRGGSPAENAPATESPEPPAPNPEQPEHGGHLEFRFRMESPANEDFAFKDEQIFVYLRPDTEARDLVLRLQGREQNFIRIFWDDSEFYDILGRRYKIVPADVELQQAAFGIPPTDVAPGSLYSTRLRLLDVTNTQAVRQLGSRPAPVVPPDAGTAEQIRGQTFELELAVEINDQRRTMPFTFEIRDVLLR